MNKTTNRANRGVRYFHKWSNKGYSIFNSLKVSVKICVIPVTYSLVMSPTISVAQTDTTSISKHIDIEEVVVSSKNAATYSDLSRVVMVVTQEEIQQLSASSIQDVLEKLINIDIRQRGGQGVQADMTFRGGTFDQTLVLLNGVNITDPQTGHHNLNIPIDLNSIQRIEVLQGPGARVYGPSAFSGAINIITRPQPENSIKISSNIGEHGLYGGNIQGTIKSKSTNSLISVSHNQSDGYIQNTDFKISNIFIHTLLTSRIGGFSLYGGYKDKGFGANSFYTPLYPNQYEKTRTLISSLEYENTWGKNKIILNGYLRRHWDRFELFRSSPPGWYKTHNYHLSSVYGSKAIYQHLTSIGRTQIGVELRNEGIISNKLGDTLSKPVKVGGEDSIYYIKGSNRFIYNLFADQVFYFKRMSISGGFNYSYCSKFLGNWSYGLDVSYLLVDKIRFYASANRSFRNPTFTDLYYEGPSNYGNPLLKPESAITYEGGFKSDYTLLSGYVGYFHRDGSNIIDWIKAPLETKYHTTNYTTLNTNGVEFSITSNLKSTNPVVKSISVGFTRLWANKEVTNVESYYALDYLKNDLRIGINHLLIRKLSALWNISWQQRENKYLATSAQFKSFWLADVRLNWIDSKYSVYADVANIFDKNYTDISRVPQPGRWISIGFTYKFFL
jgi:vitamin B12 transporter